MNKTKHEHTEQAADLVEGPPPSTPPLKSGRAASGAMSGHVRVLCTGDFQLGKAFSTLGASAKDFRNQLFETAKAVLAAGDDADLVLVAGDVFDREATPTRDIENFAKVLARCRAHVVVIAGNHDSIVSGIPGVLRAALEGLNANHVTVATDRSPVRFDDLNVTVFPASLMTRGDLSDQWSWIPDRTNEDGHRIALMHGAISSIQNGLIPEDVAARKDLDMVVLGDMHGPRHGDASASTLFDLETSLARRLVYAMAPESQNIKQGFIGAYTLLTLGPDIGDAELERVEVGEIRFAQRSADFAVEDDVSAVLEEALEDLSARPPSLTSIRLEISGTVDRQGHGELQTAINALKAAWPLFEVLDDVAVDKGDAEDDEGEDVDDPVFAALQASMVTAGAAPDVMARAKELYRLNRGWA